MKTAYKITDKNMQCRGYQFELGKTFTHDGEIGLCSSGFHFCQKAVNLFNYYSFNPENKVFEIEYGDIVIHGDYKSVTNSITFIRELKWLEVLELVNIGSGNTGNRNSGNRNSGDRNSGDCNSGDRNSGYWNSGDRNSGNSNSGDSNSGYWNSGDRNSGNSNSGYRNSGDCNSGDRNSGNRNSGDRNSGNRNSGYWNSGDRNSGDCNSGNRNSGAFCTDTDPILYLFDKPTKMTVKEWEQSKAVHLMYSIEHAIWVPFEMMTDEEKESNPNAETTDGYLKTIPLKEAWKNAWNNWTDENRKVFTSLPNFDADKFEEITGINAKV